MKGTFPINKFRELRTPFYYYDTKVLRDTHLKYGYILVIHN